MDSTLIRLVTLTENDIDMLEEVPTVQHESQSASEDTQYEALWSSIMGEGTHRDSNPYTKVSVLLIYHADDPENSTTMAEIRNLKTTFEERFKFRTSVAYLEAPVKPNLQVQLNAKIASFIWDEDDPHTLLIFYYAGHTGPEIEDDSSGSLGFVGASPFLAT